MRRDTTANWTSVNPVLGQGELGLDTTLNRFKIGDGTTAYNTLGYAPNTVFGGTGAPSGTLGVNGDIYFDTTSGATKLYGPKAAGSWGSGVTLTGATGTTGSTGPTGPGVPSSPAGTTGQVLVKNSATALDTAWANTPVDGATITITGNNVAGVPANGINTAQIAANAVGPTQLASVSVTNAKIAISATASVKGQLTGLSSVTDVPLTPASGNTAVVGNARNIATTAPLTGGGTLASDLTLAISAATVSAAGSLSAADKQKVDNLYFDVTNYGVSIANTGAANVAALNTLIQTTAPASARFWFPATGANYPMTGTITVTQNSQRFIGAGALESVIFSNNTTVNLFQITDGVSGVEFHELGFWTTAAATAGAAINAGTVAGVGNQQLSVVNCGFNPFGGTWFNCIVFNGSRGGEVSLVNGCQFNGFTNWGIGLVGNTSTPGTTSQLSITQTNMNGQITGTTGAVAGVYVQQSGAVNLTDCSIILCNNNMLVSPLVSVSQIVASIYAENTFFDSSFGSCVKFTGVGAIVRNKFTSCSFTLAAAAPNGSAAFESTNTAGNAPAGTDFVNCSFANTFGNANTTFGLNLTNIADVQLVNPKISGWTTGVSVTPQTPAGSTRIQILGGVIGPAGGVKGNGTGILLNAGATTYGLVQILGVNMPAASAFGAANTTQITDSSTIIAGGSKQIAFNSGLMLCSRPNNVTATAIPLTTVTNADSLGGLPVPAGIRAGTKIRATVVCTNAATVQTTTATLRFGTANTNADVAVATLALAVGTAAVGGGKFIAEFDITSATTGVGSITWNNGVMTAVAAPVSTGMSTNGASSAVTPSPGATIATTSASFLGFYLASATAAAVTVRSIMWEVISQ